MSDNTPDQQPQPAFMVNAQYIKDLSFELPNAPAVFADMQSKTPAIEIQVNLNAANVRDNLFEAVLSLRVTGAIEDKPAFILELSYAGLFTISVPQEHLEQALFIECPRLLFPFARAIVADVSRDGGLPPLVLQPIDFIAMYHQRMERVAAQGNA